MIRRLTPSDATFIGFTQTNDFFDGWNERMVLSAFSTGNFFGYLYEKDGEPIGYITYTLRTDEADIEDVYVTANYRRTGCASELMEQALSELKNKNVKKVFLEVKEDNVPAMRLYAAFGFNKVGERKKYYSDGKTAFVLIKEL